MVNNEHCLVQGIFLLNVGFGEILIKGSSVKEFVLKKGTVVARCVPARIDYEHLPELEVRSISNYNYSPIRTGDIDVDTSLIAKDVARLTSLLKKDSKWVWAHEQEMAFNLLKFSLVKRPVLALYNPEAETEVHTDACKFGIAGILLQRDSNLLRPVAYFSRQTTPYEQNLTAYELETLALVASVQRFRVYLIGKEFKFFTDCNSLRATFLKRDLMPRVARWWIALQEYNFTVEYRPGVAMNHVVALSRNAITSNIEEISCSVMSVDADWLATAQQADPNIQQIIAILNGPNLKELTDIKENYIIKDCKLYRKTDLGDRWVVPKGFRWQIMIQNHDDIGHFGIDKTLAKI